MKTNHTVSVGYGADGRIATAGFLQGSEEKQFAYQYLEGSNLLHRLTMPNSMTLEWGYEEHRDLVTSMTYKRGTSTVAARRYVYDNIGRPISRETTRQGSTVNDTFTYNSRSELIGATVSGKVYGYSYDNIGNRKTAQEDAEEVTSYTANLLNQYTAIQQGSGEESEANEADTFTPTYDADGNQTRIKTATGIWNVTYNAENRPIRFESADGASVIECTYDYMGRRHTRKVTLNGTVSDYLRYIYRGYLQIAAIDAVSGVFRWFLVWNPTQATATRPLAIRKDQTWYAYGWDITKNVTEVFGKAGYLRTAYTYTPYGTATADGDVTQPLTWSSEYSDEELALIYYNYRHYNPTDGRWINRDPIAEQGGWNLYAFVRNNAIVKIDLLGLLAFLECNRFPDFSMRCSVYIIEGLCSCLKCKKIADKMFHAKTSATLISYGKKLIDCAENEDADTPVMLEIIDPIYTNYGENKKNSSIPAERMYRILPKKGGGDIDIINNGITYHKGTPSPTDLDRKTPGTIYDPILGRDRNAIRIHAMGLSKGCITVGSRYITLNGNEIPLISDRTGDGYIEQLMNHHNECGGFYLEIVEMDETSEPQKLINAVEFSKNTQYAQYTRNMALTISWEPFFIL